MTSLPWESIHLFFLVYERINLPVLTLKLFKYTCKENFFQRTNWLLCFSPAPGLLSTAREIPQIDRWETLQICGFQPQENLRHWWRFNLVIPTVVLRQLPGLSPASERKLVRPHLITELMFLPLPSLSASVFAFCFTEKNKSIRQKLLQLPTSLPVSTPILTTLPPVSEKEVALGLWTSSSLPSSSINSCTQAYVSPVFKNKQRNTFYQFRSPST